MNFDSMPPQPSINILANDFLCCSRSKALDHALQLYVHVSRSGIQTHKTLGSYIISTLAQLGYLNKAQNLLDNLPHKNGNYSWNSLINGYFHHGNPRASLDLYHRMKRHAIYPNSQTFVTLLQACGKLKDLQTGCEVHDDLVKQNILEKDIHLSSALIDMYGKCDSLSLAQEAFDGLPVRNVVIWNALISGYTHHGHDHIALMLHKEMQIEGVFPDAVTFTLVVKACGCLGEDEEGAIIHIEICKRGLLNSYVGSALIDMYVKCGTPDKAKEVFDQLPARNVVTYTALISGYVQHDMAEEALICYESMESDGILPNATTYACCFKACGAIRAVDKSIQILAEVARKGYLELSDPSISVALLNMYTNFGMLREAQDVFNSLPAQDVISWNTLIAGYAQHELYEEALKCFCLMCQQNVTPDSTTLVWILRVCGNMGDLEKGIEIHAEIIRRDLLEIEASVGNALIDMYFRCESLSRGHEVFDMLPNHNTIVWNSLIAGYVQLNKCTEAIYHFKQMKLDGVPPDEFTIACILKACVEVGDMDMGIKVHAEVFESRLLNKDPYIGSTLVDLYAKSGLLSKAQEVFNILPDRDEVTWTTLISGYQQQGYGEEALKYFYQMQCEGVSPNAVTLSCVLSACGSIGALEVGAELHAEVARSGQLPGNIVIGSVLVDMYAKCGSIREAQDAFNMLPFCNNVTWNSLITGYAQQGLVEMSMSICRRMINEGNEPDHITFLNLLNACAHAGLIDVGHMCLKDMAEQRNVIPNLNHYTCMVDLMGRAGLMDQAILTLNNAPFHLDMITWLAMINSCKKLNDGQLGRKVFAQATQFNENEPALYVCMRNIYVTEDMQEAYVGE